MCVQYFWFDPFWRLGQKSFKRIGSFFRQWSFKKKCFWDLPTFMRYKIAPLTLPIKCSTKGPLNCHIHSRTHALTNSYVIYGWYLSWSSISLVWDSTRAVCILFNMARTGLFFWFFRAITALDKPESELCTVERRILPFPEVCFSLSNAQWIIKTWKK